MKSLTGLQVLKTRNETLTVKITWDTAQIFLGAFLLLLLKQERMLKRGRDFPKLQCFVTLKMIYKMADHKIYAFRSYRPDACAKLCPALITNQHYEFEIFPCRLLAPSTDLQG